LRPTASRCSGSPRRRRRAESIPRVAVYHAQGCHLCDRARAQLSALSAELGFELEEIDIGGDPELEREYREWLPVVEIDGVRRFVYYVDERAFRRALRFPRRRA
jgi:glutaredoxin